VRHRSDERQKSRNDDPADEEDKEQSNELHIPIVSEERGTPTQPGLPSGYPISSCTPPLFCAP